MLMVPDSPLADTPDSELRVFQRLLDAIMPDRWYAFHAYTLSPAVAKRSGEIDFLLVGPPGIFALEVKGGRIVFENGQWHSGDRQGRRHPIGKPEQQAADGVYAMQDWLRSSGKFETIDHLVFGYGCIFPDSELPDPAPMLTPQLILDKKQWDEPIQHYLERVVAFWHAKFPFKVKYIADELVLAIATQLGYVPPLDVPPPPVSGEAPPPPTPPPPPPTKRVLGIDLGTTNSVAAIVDETGKLRTLKIQGTAPQELMKSVVYVDPSGKVLVGEDAEKMRDFDPSRYISSVKTAMGTTKTWEIDGRRWTPTDLSAEIIKEVVRRASADLGGVTFDRLIVTVPARFDLKARQATAAAAGRAGFPAGSYSDPWATHRLFSESDAAAFSYWQDRDPKSPQTLLVYDMGGGTFDVSILKIDPTAEDLDKRVALLGAAGGDPRLGGDVIDQRIFEDLVVQFNTGSSEPPLSRDYPDFLDFSAAPPRSDLEEDWTIAQAELARLAREIKELLGGRQGTVSRTLPTLVERSAKGRYVLSRDGLEALIVDILDRADAHVDGHLAAQGLTPADIDRVVLVGGTTRIPAIPGRLTKRFGKQPYSHPQPDRAIALGAAWWGRQELIGAATAFETFLTTPIGIRVNRIDRRGIVGETTDNAFHPVLLRDAPVPARETITVTTTASGQRRLVFEVFQKNKDDESRLCDPDDFIGWFELELPTSRPRGEPRIDLTFSIDQEMTHVVVDAVDRESGAMVAEQMQLNPDSTSVPPRPETQRGSADIVIAFDTTGSMRPYIADMKRLTRDFAGALHDRRVDYRLALIDFRDETIGLKPTIHPFTNDVERFQAQVDSMEAVGGGKIPESSLDAIEHGLDLTWRDGAGRFIVLITDAPSWVPSQRGSDMGMVAMRLRNLRTTIFVVSLEKLRNFYEPLIHDNPGSAFIEMGQRLDETILAQVATEIGLSVVGEGE